MRLSIIIPTARRPIATTMDGTCLKDFAHLSDLAEAHVRALKYPLAGSQIAALNLGTGIVATTWAWRRKHRDSVS